MSRPGPEWEQSISSDEWFRPVENVAELADALREIPGGVDVVELQVAIRDETADLCAISYDPRLGKVTLS